MYISKSDFIHHDSSYVFIQIIIIPVHTTMCHQWMYIATITYQRSLILFISCAYYTLSWWRHPIYFISVPQSIVHITKSMGIHDFTSVSVMWYHILSLWCIDATNDTFICIITFGQFFWVHIYFDPSYVWLLGASMVKYTKKCSGILQFIMFWSNA